MLDVHPEPEHASILIGIGHETRGVGKMDDSAYIEDIQAGRAAMASLIQEQLFTLDRDIVFEHVVHATDVDTWLRWREEQSTRSILAPQIVERLRADLTDADGEIVIVERAYAGRFVRVE